MNVCDCTLQSILGVPWDRIYVPMTVYRKKASENGWIDKAMVDGYSSLDGVHNFIS